MPGHFPIRRPRQEVPVAKAVVGVRVFWDGGRRGRELVHLADRSSVGLHLPIQQAMEIASTQSGIASC